MKGVLLYIVTANCFTMLQTALLTKPRAGDYNFVDRVKRSNYAYEKLSKKDARTALERAQLQMLEKLKEKK